MILKESVSLCYFSLDDQDKSLMWVDCFINAFDQWFMRQIVIACKMSIIFSTKEYVKSHYWPTTSSHVFLRAITLI